MEIIRVRINFGYYKHEIHYDEMYISAGIIPDLDAEEYINYNKPAIFVHVPHDLLNQFEQFINYHMKPVLQKWRCERFKTREDFEDNSLWKLTYIELNPVVHTYAKKFKEKYPEYFV